LVNLYGRAVGSNDKVPKKMRHDHLPRDKGYFNAAVLKGGEGPLIVCEGAFDAISLMAAGCARVVAIYGVEGWRWEWARDVRQLAFALDNDDRGKQKWKELAWSARLRGKTVIMVPPEAFGGCKDANEALVAGKLDVAFLHEGVAEDSSSQDTNDGKGKS